MTTCNAVAGLRCLANEAGLFQQAPLPFPGWTYPNGGTSRERELQFGSETTGFPDHPNRLRLVTDDDLHDRCLIVDPDSTHEPTRVFRERGTASHRVHPNEAPEEGATVGGLESGGRSLRGQQGIGFPPHPAGFCDRKPRFRFGRDQFEGFVKLPLAQMLQVGPKDILGRCFPGARTAGKDDEKGSAEAADS